MLKIMSFLTRSNYRIEFKLVINSSVTNIHMTEIFRSSNNVRLQSQT